MRLTSYTNYSLRVLMYCALHRDRLVTIPEIATAFDISRAHLLKSARHLGQLGYLHTVRGRNGGIELALAPERISIGEAIRALETPVTLSSASTPSATSAASRAPASSPAC